MNLQNQSHDDICESQSDNSIQSPTRKLTRPWSSLLKQEQQQQSEIESTKNEKHDFVLDRLWDWALDHQGHKKSSLNGILYHDNEFNSISENESLTKALVSIVGMKNRGNTCFMNAILQALLHLPLFSRMIVNITPYYEMSDLLKSPLLESFTSLISECNRTSKSIMPDNFYARLLSLKRFGAASNLETQEDAHEFLLFLIEELHQEMIQCKKENLSNTLSNVNDDSDGWMQITGKKNRSGITRTHSSMQVNTPIGKLFGGSFQSILRTAYQKDSITYEPFRSIEIDIEPDNINSLEDALSYFTRIERINHSITKQTLFQYLPHILIIQLKRFIWTPSKGVIKLEKFIRFPRNLSLPKQLFAPGHYDPTCNSYRLVAIILHHGHSVHGGHYTCMVSKRSQWFELDDENVQRIAFESWNKNLCVSKLPTPYLLFYETNIE